MDGIDRLVIEQNVWRFIDRLVHEPEPRARDTIAHLLQAEEDKFARSVERYEIAERWIEKCDRLIAHSNRLMAKDSHANRALLRSGIRNMEEIRAILVSFCASCGHEMDEAAKFVDRDQAVASSAQLSSALRSQES